jgi:hypothetical protein
MIEPTRFSLIISLIVAGNITSKVGLSESCFTSEKASNREASSSKTSTQPAGRGVKEIRFQWRPPGSPPEPYRLDDPLDQHRILIYPGSATSSYPVLVGFHGQPKRGKPPRNYKFGDKVIKRIIYHYNKKEIGPLVLVLPVFRFMGQNWPSFDAKAFRQFVEDMLRKNDISTENWYVFGHSGAAGCGGDGLNRAHRMNPRAVGFFDTCLGRGWQDQVRQLDKLRIYTVNIHSVETAGFRPKQRPEYQSRFDFGRAYAPLGLKPTKCPAKHPGKRLRALEYRCASTQNGSVKAFVVDTGEGVEAHESLLEVALDYFLDQFFRAHL